MMSEIERAEKKLDIATEALSREIGLFWSRALFFWGFISAAFIAYAASLGKSETLPLLIASFGMVCSFAWTLLNRGSKYWQESWEQKIERAEKDVIGSWFIVREDIKRKVFCLTPDNTR
jgi:hypothetical protein